MNGRFQFRDQIYPMKGPVHPASEYVNRREKLLSPIIISLLLLDFLSLIPIYWISSIKNQFHAENYIIVTFFFFVFLLAYWLSSTGKYLLAARMVALSVGLGSWAGLFIQWGEPEINPLALNFVLISVFLSGLFLSLRATALVIGFNLAGFLVLSTLMRIDIEYLILSVTFTIVISSLILVNAILSNRDRSRIDRYLFELVRAYKTTLEGWSRAMELRDRATEKHTLRVTELTLRLAQALGILGVDLINIQRGALLHDIGKMGIPDSILLKPAPLTEEEKAIIRQHPLIAHELLSPIEYLRPALAIPYCHHEKWDGTGYPDGLAGEEIPFSARIFAVVDVWDALTSDRPYRTAWPPEEARLFIEQQAGKHFDPLVVEVFLREIEKDVIATVIYITDLEGIPVDSF